MNVETKQEEAKQLHETKCVVKFKSHNGVKVHVWAKSVDEAIQKAKAVICAKDDDEVVYCKSARLSISDIKYRLGDDDLFFSRNTMSFFRQTMKDFKVRRRGDINFYICAPMPYGLTERIYLPFENKLIFDNNKNDQ